MNQKLTIRDIAAACGVTIATVSRVINNKPGVRKEIRKHVQRYVEQIGWNCSSLKNRIPRGTGAKTVLILCGLNVLNGGGRFSMQEALQILIDRLEQEGILPLVVFGRSLQMLEECRRLKPYAVLLFQKNPWMEEPIRRLRKAGIRVAVAYADAYAGSCPQVHSDYESATRSAIRRFRALGCRKIGLFAGNGMLSHPKSPDDIAQYWVQCIATTLERTIPEFSLERNVISDQFGTAEELRKTLRRGEFDAWICCEYTMLLRFCREAEEMGIRVPEDLPVSAFCSECAGVEAPLRVDHFISQADMIADRMFRWVMEESFPEPEEITIPYLWQKGAAAMMQKKPESVK